MGNIFDKAEEVIGDFFLAVGEVCTAIGEMMTGGRRTVLSAEDQENPPISQVLLVRKRGDLVPCFANVLKNKNVKAFKNIIGELDDLGLNHIAYAFEKGVDMNMMCCKCNNRLENIDQLCYCAEAAERCHHCKCCSFRGIRALTFG